MKTISACPEISIGSGKIVTQITLALGNLSQHYKYRPFNLPWILARCTNPLYIFAEISNNLNLMKEKLVDIEAFTFFTERIVVSKEKKPSKNTTSHLEKIPRI